MAKNDEFYTRMPDIEKELSHYTDHLKGKIVYCNCDSDESNFVKYFRREMDNLGLKAVWNTSDDFRSEANRERLTRADVVITNPPFSLFREYVDLLIESGKGFLVIGSLMAAAYKEIYPLIQSNKIWFGSGGRLKMFDTPNGPANVGNTTWYTNLSHAKRAQPIPLFKRYDPALYPTYDNCDAIEVGKTAEIPMDYDGAMGVPVSFLEKHDPTQFELLQRLEKTNPLIHSKASNGRWGDLSIGSRVFPKRVLIKARRVDNGDGNRSA